MEPSGEEATSRSKDRLSEDELESAFDSAVTSARARATRASDRMHSLVSEVKRLSHEELARVQALAGADEWFLEGDGKPVGPLSTAQMKERWLAHAIRPESRGWGVGLPGWTPLCRITALARALGPQPAYPVRTPHPPPPPADAAEPPPPEVEPKREMLPELAVPPIEYTRPTRPRPMLREEPAPAPSARSGQPYPPESPEHLWREVVPVPRARPSATHPPESSDDLPVLLPEPARPARARPGSREVMPVRARSSAASPREEPYEEEAPVSRSAHRALRTLVGAMIGLGAVLTLVALIALPPLLSPPKPMAPAPMAASASASAPAPAPAPATGRQPAPERPVKKSASPEPDPAPAPSADPDTEAAFDRAFGPPGAPRPVQKPAERSVYIPPAPPKPAGPPGRLTDADVMAVVVAHKAQIVKCRNQARAQEPELAGRLLMRWTVSVDGEPEDVEALPGDLQDTGLAFCVTQAILGWKFPRHTAEQPPITFPFVF